MRRVLVHAGTMFSDLKVIREVSCPDRRRFLCVCGCGRELAVRLDHLRSGHTSSCGRCGLEFGGERKTLKRWGESRGIKESTLRARLKLMSLGEALERGPKERG